MPHPRHAAARPSGYPEDPELERAAAEPAVAAAIQVMLRRKHCRAATWWLLFVLVLFVPVCWDAAATGTPVWLQVIMIAITSVLVAWLAEMIRAWAVGDKEWGRIPVEAQAAALTIIEYRTRVRDSRGLRNILWSVFAWSVFSVGLLLFLGLAVLCAPLAINGAAYLAGAGTTATFTPTSHEQSCDSKGKCSIVTDGFVGSGASRTTWTWHGNVPLDHSFPIREPVVQSAATVPVQSDWSAVGNLAGGLLGFLAGALLSFLIVLRAVGGRWWLYLTRRSREYRPGTA
jgi:hypothetical protein